MKEFKDVGFIYKNEKGEFLVRVINRCFGEAPYYSLHFVKDIQDSMLFSDEVKYHDSIEYRTLFSKEMLESCKKIKVERVFMGIDPYIFNVIEE